MLKEYVYVPPIPAPFQELQLSNITYMGDRIKEYHDTQFEVFLDSWGYLSMPCGNISESRESTAQYLFYNKINYPVTEKCLMIAKGVFLLISEWLYRRYFYNFSMPSHTFMDLKVGNEGHLWSASTYYI